MVTTRFANFRGIRQWLVRDALKTLSKWAIPTEPNLDMISPNVEKCDESLGPHREYVGD